MTAAAKPKPGGQPSRPGAGSQLDRATMIAAAVLLVGAIVLGVGAVAVFSDPGTPAHQSQSGLDAPPHIIPRPNSGQAPQEPGDRGGWEQLLLLGMIIVAIGAIAMVITRGGGTKARANRAAWHRAAESDHDGALDD